MQRLRSVLPVGKRPSPIGSTSASTIQTNPLRPSVTVGRDLGAKWASQGSPTSILQPQRHLVHKPSIIPLGQPRRLGRHRAKQIRKPVHLRLGVIAEDVLRHLVLVAGMADADSDSAKLVADMGFGGAEAVMAGGSAA